MVYTKKISAFPYSAGIDFSRQNLTSVDSGRCQILTTKVDPALQVRVEILLMNVDP